MFRATGPGKIFVGFDNGVGIVEALLYNFDFDDFNGRQFRPLKVEHARFLNDRIVPIVENGRGAVWLQGSASQIGTNAWNMETSMVRAGQVQGYLADHGIPLDRIQPDAVGEENTLGHLPDEDRDRSVLLWAYPLLEFNPPPPRTVPRRPKTTRHFKIALVTSVSLSQSAKITKFLKGKLSRGVAVDAMAFIVWDTQNNLSCLYLYIGVGLGSGLSFTPSVSGTMHGPWNSFTTEKPIGVWQFGRWSRFTTASAFKWSYNWITIETPKGVDNIDSLSIETGTTLGIGASTTVGDFIRIEGPSPFNG
jgi:hypothetical protein